MLKHQDLSAEVRSEIVRAVVEHFASFGGGRDSDMNPITHALKDKAPMFAAGVDIAAVVEFVIQEYFRARYVPA